MMHTHSYDGRHSFCIVLDTIEQLTKDVKYIEDKFCVNIPIFPCTGTDERARSLGTINRYRSKLNQSDTNDGTLYYIKRYDCHPMHMMGWLIITLTPAEVGEYSVDISFDLTLPCDGERVGFKLVNVSRPFREFMEDD